MPTPAYEMTARGVYLHSSVLPDASVDLKWVSCVSGRVGTGRGVGRDVEWRACDRYLINGDVADRGEHACEILLLIFALKLLHPEWVYFTRGNHETDWMNSDDHCGGACLRACLSIGIP